MDTLHALGQGFASALTLPHLVWAFAGVTLGTAVGVLPGIGPALTIALLLPVTFTLEPTSAFIMFAGIDYGAMYGAPTTSILLNAPGETAAIVTDIDGSHRIVRGGHACHGGAGVLRATPRIVCAALRPRRVLRADSRCVHDRVGAARLVDCPGTLQPLSGPGVGTGRHRPAVRRGAIVVRHLATARRDRRRHLRHRIVRRR